MWDSQKRILAEIDAAESDGGRGWTSYVDAPGLEELNEEARAVTDSFVGPDGVRLPLRYWPAV